MLNKAQIIAPAAGTAISLVAAADVHLGGGTVDWLVDLCLTDPDTPMMAPELPMRAHTDVLPFLAAATGFASVTCLSVYFRHQNQNPGPGTAFTEVQFRVLAVLAMMANAVGNLGPRAVALAYQAHLSAPLRLADARLALDLFRYEELDDDIGLFDDTHVFSHRRTIICAAIEFARRARDPGAMVEVMDAVAGAMNMTPVEIERHWAAYQNSKPAKARNRLSLGNLIPQTAIGPRVADVARQLRHLAQTAPIPRPRGMALGAAG